MKPSTFLLCVLCLPLAVGGCIKDNVEIENVPPEGRAFFMGYKIGTRWIYEDTLMPGQFDTIELVTSKQSNQSAQKKGFIRSHISTSEGIEMEYATSKGGEFRISVRGRKGDSYYISMSGLQSVGGGEVWYEQGQYTSGATRRGRMDIGGTAYPDVLEVNSVVATSPRALLCPQHGAGCLHQL